MSEGRAIYKYQLHTDGGAQILHMPRGAKIVKTGFQRGRACLWALVNTSLIADVPHTYEVFGTGSLIPKGLTYIDTVFEETFVWHIFERED